MSENLIQQITEKKSELFQKRLALHSGQFNKTHEIKQVRREIARLLTSLNKAGK